jgi:hypothetical protein
MLQKVTVLFFSQIAGLLALEATIFLRSVVRAPSLQTDQPAGDPRRWSAANDIKLPDSQPPVPKVGRAEPSHISVQQKP